MANKQNKRSVPKPVPQNTVSVSVQKPEEPKAKYSIHLKLAVLLGLISFLVYANTLRNGFALDDGTVIVENTIVKKGMSAIPEILSTPYRHGLFSTTKNDLYRPLSLVMFATEYQFFKENPLPFHFMNILIFIGCVILLFRFLDDLFERRKTAVAFITALLFALHPIHTEVVANIKSRDELLCFFFAFLSLNIFLKYMSSGKMTQLLTGALCFFLSFLSKETVVTFVAVIPMIFFFYSNGNKKRSAYISVTALVVAIICIAIRVSVLNYYHANEISNINFMDNALTKPDLPYESRIATAILILGFYVKLFIVPYPLICDYSFDSIPFTHFNDPLVLLSLALYVFLAIFAIKRFLKNKKDPYAFAVLFFLITISLFSNIPFLIGTTMGERLMFFPSVGFCLAAALLIQMLVKNTAILEVLKNKKVLAIIIPVSIIYAGITIKRNGDWIDSYTLFKSGADMAPNDSKLHFDVGDMDLNANYAEKDTAKKRQILNEGISYLERAVEIYPEYGVAHIDLGWSYYLLNNFDSAEAHEKIATELMPLNKIALNDLAVISNIRKKYPQAIALFKKVLELDPGFGGVHSTLGDAYFSIGQYDSAEVHDQLAIKEDPKNIGAINDLAGVYFFRKKYPQAIDLYKKAIEFSPKFVRPYANVGVCYLYLEKYDSAVYYSNLAIAVDPAFNTPYETIAATYKAAGKTDSAKKYEVIAQKNNPGFKL